ncbi:30S ribosomal protein S3 [Labeo rohita]|uniref:30S ribosomal protein S3 n=1 Tax=Labeo rohita TaxID=84645 RepID=A0ABQ8L568_LABRO|nr:30S ribosomal protein S3 [Labeo rohita]
MNCIPAEKQALGTNVAGTKVYRTAFSGNLSSGELLHSDWLPPSRVIAHYHKVDLTSTLPDAHTVQNAPCSFSPLLAVSLLETIKQQQDQLVAKVNYLSSRLNSTPGPDVEMPNNIHFPLENLEAVEAFEMFLKEPSNGPARQKVISSLATIGGQDVKRVTWNILGRLFTDEVSHQINWKGVNNKKPFSRMATKTLLFISHGGGGHQARNQVVQPGDGSGNEETCPASIHTNGVIGEISNKKPFY